MTQLVMIVQPSTEPQHANLFRGFISRKKIHAYINVSILFPCSFSSPRAATNWMIPESTRYLASSKGKSHLLVANANEFDSSQYLQLLTITPMALASCLEGRLKL